MSIVKKTYKDQVIEYVYQLILKNDLKPGDQLKETLLAEQMGISRAPVREAMKELIINGLVDYRPQVGNFIPSLSAQQIVDSYTTRGVLEGFAVMECCDQFSAADIEKLDCLVGAMEDCARNGEHLRVIEIGGEFHDFLISKNSNVQLIDYTDRLSLKLHVLFFKYWGRLYSPAEIGRRHREIVASVKAGDGDRIEKVIRRHYAETGSKIAEL